MINPKNIAKQLLRQPVPNRIPESTLFYPEKGTFLVATKTDSRNDTDALYKLDPSFIDPEAETAEQIAIKKRKEAEAERARHKANRRNPFKNIIQDVKGLVNNVKTNLKNMKNAFKKPKAPALDGSGTEAPESEEAEASIPPTILITGISYNSKDLVTPVSAFNDKKLFFLYGQDFDSVSVNCMALLGGSSEYKLYQAEQAIDNYFNSHRLSNYKKPVKLISASKNEAKLFYITELMKGDVDPEFNVLPFRLSGFVVGVTELATEDEEE